MPSTPLALSSPTHALGWFGLFAVLVLVAASMFCAGYVVRGSR